MSPALWAMKSSLQLLNFANVAQNLDNTEMNVHGGVPIKLYL